MGPALEQTGRGCYRFGAGDRGCADKFHFLPQAESRTWSRRRAPARLLSSQRAEFHIRVIRRSMGYRHSAPFTQLISPH